MRSPPYSASPPGPGVPPVVSLSLRNSVSRKVPSEQTRNLATFLSLDPVNVARRCGVWLRGAESIPCLSKMLYVNFHAFLRIPLFFRLSRWRVVGLEYCILHFCTEHCTKGDDERGGGKVLRPKTCACQNFNGFSGQSRGCLALDGSV